MVSQSLRVCVCVCGCVYVCVCDASRLRDGQTAEINFAFCCSHERSKQQSYPSRTTFHSCRQACTSIASAVSAGGNTGEDGDGDVNDGEDKDGEDKDDDASAISARSSAACANAALAAATAS